MYCKDEIFILPAEHLTSPGYITSLRKCIQTHNNPSGNMKRIKKCVGYLSIHKKTKQINKRKYILCSTRLAIYQFKISANMSLEPMTSCEI